MKGAGVLLCLHFGQPDFACLPLASSFKLLKLSTLN